MTTRNQAVKSLRSEILADAIQTNPNQLFQDNTLRPILKFQNNIINLLFREYLTINKVNFENLTKTQRNQQIEQSLKKNQNIQTLLKGIVIALFDESELDFWVSNKDEVNKRIQQLLIRRIQQSFEIHTV